MYITHIVTFVQVAVRDDAQKPILPVFDIPETVSPTVIEKPVVAAADTEVYRQNEVRNMRTIHYIIADWYCNELNCTA